MDDSTTEAMERLKLQKTLAKLSHRLSEVEARLCEVDDRFRTDYLLRRPVSNQCIHPDSAAFSQGVIKGGLC